MLAVAGVLVGVGARLDLAGAAADSAGSGGRLTPIATRRSATDAAIVTAGPITFSMRLSSLRLSVRRRPVVLSIRMQTAGTSGTAGIGLVASRWPDPAVFGIPLALGSPRISGPGMITGGFASGGISLPGGVPLCFRGADSPDGGGVEVSLPANTTSTLTYTVGYAAAPWPQLRPTVGAFAYVPAVSNTGSPATSLGTVHLLTAGRYGLRISLSAPNAVRLGANDLARRVHRGGTVTIVGKTAPLLPDALVKVVADYYAHPNLDHGHRQELIGTARTNRAGIFHVGWRPRRNGDYLIVATPIATRPKPNGDSGCDLTLAVR